MISALGAMIAMCTLTLIVITGYFIYKVYYVGELRMEEPVKEVKDREAVWIDEERKV